MGKFPRKFLHCESDTSLNLLGIHPRTKPLTWWKWSCRRKRQQHRVQEREALFFRHKILIPTKLIILGYLDVYIIKSSSPIGCRIYMCIALIGFDSDFNQLGFWCEILFCLGNFHRLCPLCFSLKFPAKVLKFMKTICYVDRFWWMFLDFHNPIQIRFWKKN